MHVQICTRLLNRTRGLNYTEPKSHEEIKLHEENLEWRVILAQVTILHGGSFKKLNYLKKITDRGQGLGVTVIVNIKTKKQLLQINIKKNNKNIS